jgi:hypothetical protein
LRQYWMPIRYARADHRGRGSSYRLWFTVSYLADDRSPRLPCDYAH